MVHKGVIIGNGTALILCLCTWLLFEKVDHYRGNNYDEIFCFGIGFSFSDRVRDGRHYEFG